MMPASSSASSRTMVLLPVILAFSCVISHVHAFDFAWGFGASSMQIEGGWNEGGKSESTYDRWFHTVRAGQPNADVAADHYHRWREDVGYMGQLKATAYRFSISWPRILPNCTGQVNEEGVKFYSDLIDEMIAQGIEPFLTMYHWDMPQVCWERYQGFLTKEFVNVFAEYATVLYDRFGDRVRYWLTLNELEANCQFSFATGIFAPGHVGGDTAKNLCIYHSHLIHGTVVDIARKRYDAVRRGWKFGLPSIFAYFEPVGEASRAEANARQAAVAALFFDPVVIGDWGPEIKGDPSLPAFTAEESAMLRGTMDFSAVNYYSASGVGGSLPFSMPSGIDWQFVYPAGIRGLLNFFNTRYPLDIYITEIGYPVPDEHLFETSARVADDPLRQAFWEMIVGNVTAAVVEDGVRCKGMLVWSILDNMEWVNYVPRFGAIAVDYFNGTLTRTIKQSTFYLSDRFASMNLTSPFGVRAAVPAITTTTSATSTRAATTSTMVETTRSVAVATTTTTKSGGAGRKVGVAGLESVVVVVMMTMMM
ncbi:glycoside hydrolase superfamily [Chytridium lagenaria]|nr:glycoside hydrolase superfamily [Chytridium lagenaria]